MSSEKIFLRVEHSHKTSDRMVKMEDKVSEALKKIHHDLNIKAKSVLSCIRYGNSMFGSMLVETGLDITTVFSMDSDLKNPAWQYNLSIT